MLYDKVWILTEGAGLVSNAQLRCIMHALKDIVDELRQLGSPFPSGVPAYASFPYGPYTNT